MKKKILVTGGAGYIGSFIVRELEDKGYRPFVVDNMTSGHKGAIQGFPFRKIDLVTEQEKLSQLFREERFSGVVHMASYIQMGESFKNPGKYFRNNLETAINLLDTMVVNRCNYIIFSSSAGVYGNPKSLPIKEDDPKSPENPYGETKLMIERMLHWYDQAHSIKSVSIRYFNAAGASLDGQLGEDHPGESHIIPLIIKAAISGGKFRLFGDDYKTKDGTCVRDYIHVLDLAKAHILSLDFLFRGEESNYFNAGVGKGYSNLEIIRQVEKMAGKFKWEFAPRRLGDADSLYASTTKIRKMLNWRPKYGLKEIIQSAYYWHKSHPNGYSSK
jgi:UDP-glucose 4-epimerase